jgi:L-ascorbate metabolism protein UlaG (beta-lactamase superfamily)
VSRGGTDSHDEGNDPAARRQVSGAVMTTPRPFSPVDTTRSVGSLFFVGNATVLLRVAGLTLLTDPNFVPAGTSVPLGYGLSTTRLTDPAMTMDELPPLDAVLLSHFHGDHFDQLAEERLDRGVPIVTTPEASKMLQARGFGQTVPLETWSRHEIHGPAGIVRVTALPGRHAPKPLDVPLPDVMGSLVEVWNTASVADGVAATPAADQQPDLRMYITGDTIVYEGLREIPQRVPGIDLALLHLGGTRVMGVTVTMDAEQGVELLQMMRPVRAAAIHYDDYEAFKSPIEDFVEAVRTAGLGDGVHVLERGETFPL